MTPADLIIVDDTQDAKEKRLFNLISLYGEAKFDFKFETQRLTFDFNKMVGKKRAEFLAKAVHLGLCAVVLESFIKLNSKVSCALGKPAKSEMNNYGWFRGPQEVYKEAVKQIMKDPQGYKYFYGALTSHGYDLSLYMRYMERAGLVEPDNSIPENLMPLPEQSKPKP